MPFLIDIIKRYETRLRSVISIDHWPILEALLCEFEKAQRYRWQSLETAPRDGVTKVLYGCYKGSKWYVKVATRGPGVDDNLVKIPTGFLSYTTATHCIPLPGPPVCGCDECGKAAKHLLFLNRTK